jgi:hypothetical protein
MKDSATVIVTTLLDPNPISKRRWHQYKQNQYPAIAPHADRIIHVKDGLLINGNMNT